MGSAALPPLQRLYAWLLFETAADVQEWIAQVRAHEALVSALALPCRQVALWSCHVITGAASNHQRNAKAFAKAGADQALRGFAGRYVQDGEVAAAVTGAFARAVPKMRTWGQRHGLGKAKQNVTAMTGKGEEHALMFKEFLIGLKGDPDSFVKRIDKSRAKKDMEAEEQDRLEFAIGRVASCNSDGNAVKNVLNTDAAFLRHTTPMVGPTLSTHTTSATISTGLSHGKSTSSNLERASRTSPLLAKEKCSAKVAFVGSKVASILHCETQVVCL